METSEHARNLDFESLPFSLSMFGARCMHAWMVWDKQTTNHMREVFSVLCLLYLIVSYFIQYYYPDINSNNALKCVVLSFR